MSLPETTDYPSLALEHASFSCTDVHIVGLQLKVYGLEEIKGSNLPIAAVVSSPSVHGPPLMYRLKDCHSWEMQ